MNRRSLFWPSILPGLAQLSGCNSPPSTEEAFADVQALLAERGVERVHWNQGTEADLQVEEAVQELLASELSVDAAVQVALLNNRNLQATYEELGVAQADLVQAGLFHNPILSFEARFPERASFPLELDIAQDFLSVFLMPLKKRVAEAEFEAAKLRVADLVLELTKRVRVAFYAFQATQQMLELHRSIAEASEASADAAQRLHDAGNIIDLDLVREQAMFGRAKLERSMAEAALADARDELAALLGLSQGQFTAAERLPDLPAEEISAADLEQLALAARLDLAAVRAESEALARILGVERYAALEPGVNVTGHLEREPEGATTTGPSLEIPIPLFDTGRAARARTRARLRASEERYAALAIEIRSEVRRATTRLLISRQRAEAWRGELLPLYDRIVAETQLEYNGMQTGVFELLLAKQGEIEAGKTYIESLLDYWVARTELERTLGGRLKATSEMAPAPEEEQPPPQPKQEEETEQPHHHGKQS